MIGASTAITLALALVLLISGTLKLAPRGRVSLEDLSGLRAPRVLRTAWFTWALPISEVLVGLSLLVLPSPLFTTAALGALALFSAFLYAVVSVVLRGDRVACACFGMLRAPVTAVTVVRNAALLLAALIVMLTAQAGILHTMASLEMSQWTGFSAAVTAVLAVVVLILLLDRAQSRSASDRQDGVAAGSSAAAGPWPTPDVEVLSASGRFVPLRELAQTRPLLLVLLSAQCHACAQVAPRLAGWVTRFGGRIDVAALTSDELDDLRAGHPQLAVSVHRGARAVMATSGIAGFPAALLLGTDGTVVAGPAVGSDEVLQLASTIAEVIAV